MGAWSCESFGNDDACDWVYELEESDHLDFVESTLDAVLATGDDYLEASDATRAIAAAEVIARLQGNVGLRDSYSKSADNWVDKVKLVPSANLANKARRALDRILGESSELFELWQESEESDAWVEAVTHLKERIRA
ncbi:DUF4259 domain-containing protein [Methylomagnum sp.]